jgi:hypothetical protein
VHLNVIQCVKDTVDEELELSSKVHAFFPFVKGTSLGKRLETAARLG